MPGGLARIRLEVEGAEAWDAAIGDGNCTLRPIDRDRRCDARITADAETWARVVDDAASGMEAFQLGRLRVRDNLHLGIGFIAATSDDDAPEGLRFGRVEIDEGEISYVAAGPPKDAVPVLCLHGLGATKASFMPTVRALAERHRVIAIDLPGFGDSAKPTDAPYDAIWFAGVVERVMEALDLERVHLLGNSMGGRIAIECALRAPERIASIGLLTPALAWLRDRPWRGLLSLPLPKLGLIQPTPPRLIEPLVRRLVPGASDGWTAAGVDEFIRAYVTTGGRYAFYEAARRIYLDEPYGPEGFWRRLEGMQPPSLFVWGEHDTLVPVSFRWHVERALPNARHLQLDCGHVPQLERPRETHAALAELVDSVGAGGR